MTKFSLLFFACISFIGTAFAQNEHHTENENFTKISNDSLKAFIKNFEIISYPFHFSDINKENPIDIAIAEYFLDIEPDDGFGYEEFYFNFVFLEENFICIIYTRYYTPGAFGINNYFVNLITMDYSGKIIDAEDIGCFCNDTNMGNNDYYATDLEVTIEKGEISVIKNNIHATLIDEDEEDSFEEITTEDYSIIINSEGVINK